jgi:hypothetical protein
MHKFRADADMAAPLVYGYGRNFSLFFVIDMKRSTSFYAAVKLINDIVVLLFREVNFCAWQQNAFFDKRPHYVEHVRNVFNRHIADSAVIVFVNHCAGTEV